MKYLITGGAGFIGSNFIHYLFEKYPDVEVINLDNLSYSANLKNLKEFENSPRYKFVKGDIADEKIVNELVGQVDVIVNFAAQAHVDRSILGPTEFVRTNVLGTLTLLEAAREDDNKRFHHVSTDEVYGSIPLDSEEKWTEESPYKPRSPYSASKAGSDHLVRAYFETFNLPVTISNCANNVGPYMYPERLIPLAITNLLEGKKVPIYGNGQQIREWLYVEDHCSAIDLILEKGKPGETYFVGPNDDHLNNLDTIKMILKIMNLDEDRIEFVKDRPGHDQKYSLDTTKIQKDLGWKPEYSLDETLRKTVEWYTTNQEWWKKIKNSEEYRTYYQKQYKK
jgi:dTDP-glucose 4,6-dehydratase